MGGQCNAKPLRRQTGWFRWFAACPCGWRSEASGREDAAALAKRHNTETARADGSTTSGVAPCREAAGNPCLPVRTFERGSHLGGEA